MTTSDEVHIMVVSLKLIEFRFWVQFLIGKFILEVTFLFDWDLCGEYRHTIEQVGIACIYSPELGQANWPILSTWIKFKPSIDKSTYA